MPESYIHTHTHTHTHCARTCRIVGARTRSSPCRDVLTVFFGSRDYDERASHAISGQTLTLLLAAAAAVVRGLPIPHRHERELSHAAT